MKRVLVTGGAGYVGSHIVRRLREAGREVLVLDDLSAGHRAALGGAPLVEGDFGNPALLDRALRNGDVGFIVHMAAHCRVGESMADPAKYYDNNLVRSLRLLEAACKHGVAGIVFSSSAAVYGDPVQVPIHEEHPVVPTNPYGETKLAFERALSWYHEAYGIRFVALRYFNAAGADPDGDLGEDHHPETHLIPILLEAAAAGGPPVPIFGTDYATPDGTCVRDYVHVADLAEAHVLALAAMEEGRVTRDAFNLGNGEGFSVREVVEVVRRVTGSDLRVREADRRPGDPAVLVASSARAREVLGWRPRFASLEEIVRTAWAWHVRHPDGYGDPAGSPRPAAG